MRLTAFLIVSFFGLLIFNTSCKKDQLLSSGGDLRFSTDTLTFDTVFSEMGSFTLGLKIFNPNDQHIILSSVRLQHGSESFFRLNVNGMPGNEIKDVEIAGNDSIYVFATVKIDPHNESNPYIVEDKLIATLNGNEFSVPLYAFGQDAHYVTDSVITVNDTWLTDKPYVIIHSAQVDSGIALTIPAGCRIYMHADSRLYVLGTLIASGTKEDSIVFQGDRLDRAYFGYEGYPGEWGGIYFAPSSANSKLEWVVIKNCGNSIGGGLPFAVEVAGVQGIGTQLTMKNTIIENSIGFGLLCFQANVKAENCLIHTTGAQALALLQGGNYSFDNCSFINYFPAKLTHTEEPTVAVLNYVDISDTEFLEGDLNANFRNCLIYGSLDNELFCYKKGSKNYFANFDHCLIQKLDPFPEELTANFLKITDCIFNQNPLFVDYKKWNFHPAENSPLIDKGTNLAGISNDLDNQPWSAPFDIGAYQYMP